VYASTWLIATIAWMTLAGLFVDDSSLAADLYGLATVTLMGRDVCDAAVRCRWLYQLTNDPTHRQAWSLDANGLRG